MQDQGDNERPSKPDRRRCERGSNFAVACIGLLTPSISMVRQIAALFSHSNRELEVDLHGNEFPGHGRRDIGIDLDILEAERFVEPKRLVLQASRFKAHR